MNQPHLKILRKLAKVETIAKYGQGEDESPMVVYELLTDGLVVCSNPNHIRAKSTDTYLNLRIKLAGREKLSQWEKEEKEKSISFRIIKLFEKFTIWIGIAIGASVLKVIEWGLDRYLTNLEGGQG